MVFTFKQSTVDWLTTRTIPCATNQPNYNLPTTISSITYCHYVSIAR